ncbi:MAG: DUF429 domain-containing protein [Sandaracinus sp.]
MRTVGVDLASQAANTAICEVVWTANEALVEAVTCPATDDDILAACARADACGIDAPFGWPDAFVALLAHNDRAADAWSDVRRDELRLRITDRVAHEHVGRQPLSVAADRIALAALRCRSLLARLKVADHSGDGRIFEVWPAGFRMAAGWEANKKSARADAAAELRRIRAALPWFVIPEEQEPSFSKKGVADNAVDALVAALAARAAKLGNTELPTETQRLAAVREGWIHLPRRGLAISAVLGAPR